MLSVYHSNDFSAPPTLASVRVCSTTSTNGIEESHSPSFPLEPLALVTPSQTTHPLTLTHSYTTHTTHLHRQLHHHLPSLSFLLTVSQSVSRPFPLTRLASQHHHDHDFPFCILLLFSLAVCLCCCCCSPAGTPHSTAVGFCTRTADGHSLTRSPVDPLLLVPLVLLLLLLLLRRRCTDAQTNSVFERPRITKSIDLIPIQESRQAGSVRFKVQTMEAMRSKAVYGPVS